MRFIWLGWIHWEGEYYIYVVIHERYWIELNYKYINISNWYGIYIYIVYAEGGGDYIGMLYQN